jgi:biotin operon repressor
MSQTQDILEHLKSGEPITPMDALNKFGCFRLASRINELRDCGYDIETRIKRTTNGKQIAEYTLKGE